MYIYIYIYTCIHTYIYIYIYPAGRPDPAGPTRPAQGGQPRPRRGGYLLIVLYITVKIMILNN